MSRVQGSDMRGQEDGQELAEPRLLVQVVSQYAQNDPQKIWAALPKDASDASYGYEDITFARLAYSVDRAARWLVSTLRDVSSREFEPLAYMGPPDSRYVILVLASIKAGFQMLFLSPRNSDEAQYHVMNQAGCNKFLCASSMRKRVDTLINNRPVQSSSNANGDGISSSSTDTLVFTVPEQEDLLRDSPEDEFPYTKTDREAKRDPLVILHTSSTTGMPKTIALNQGYGLHEDILSQLPNHNGLDIITRKPFYGECRMFVAMPLFHAGGVLLTLLKSLYQDIVAVFQPPAVPLSAAVFDGILRYGKCNGCVLPPSLLEEMIAVPSFFDTLASLKFVQFGSGPLSKAAGDTLLTRQKNCPHYIGSSEIALPPLLELDDPVTDWQYFHFHPWGGVEFRPVAGDDNLCEMFVTRTDKKGLGLQPVFELFPEIEEWPTRDLYSRHPTKPYLWRSAGRSDDVLVLSNGEKLNPVDTESRMTHSVPAIVGALVFGQGRFMPGLLLEVKGVDTENPDQREKLLREVWPIVEKSNEAAPKHGQLSKTSIIFTSPDKPFARTPKLSVRRGPTIDLYATEIADMYEKLEADLDASLDVELPPDINFGSIDSVRNLIGALVLGITGWKEVPAPDEDLFMLGLDSLHVSRLSRALKSALSRDSTLKSKSSEISIRILYSCPTTDLLTNLIHGLANNSSTNLQENAIASRETRIENLIEQYANFDIDHSDWKRSTDGSDNWTILLTGSTGSLGTYLLAHFIRDPRVSFIYCLNRSETARSRQLEAFEIQGLSVTPSDVDAKVEFVHTYSLGAPWLGLNEDKYRSLLKARPTHIVHNAWPVNFNLNLASFGSHVAGVRALIDFSAASKSYAVPKIYFVSSLSSVTALSAKSQPPESVVLDASVPSRMGYGESKYAAERILDAAAAASNGGISANILRIGQIAGPVGFLHKDSYNDKIDKGIWPMREWLPSLITSSIGIKTLPETLGRMEALEWIPVDVLASIISDLMQDTDSIANGNTNGAQTEKHEVGNNQATVYNLFNPKAASWNTDILPTVQSELGIKSKVPLRDWIRRVKDGPDIDNTAKPNPAKKIVGFYEALVIDQAAPGPSQSTEDFAERNSAKAIATKGAARRSTTFSKLEPVRPAWMKTWIGQWKLKSEQKIPAK